MSQLWTLTLTLTHRGSASHAECVYRADRNFSIRKPPFTNDKKRGHCPTLLDHLASCVFPLQRCIT